MSSLSTLLEAAKFLELQEQQQQQHRATVEAALATIKPIHNHNNNNNINHHFPVISTTSTIIAADAAVITPASSPTTTSSSSSSSSSSSLSPPHQQHLQPQPQPSLLQQPQPSSIPIMQQLQHSPTNMMKTMTVTASHNSSPPPSQQTVVISSNNISSSTVLHGPVVFPQTTTPQIVKKIDQDGQVTSTTLATQPPRRLLQNSFDIMNPLVIDEVNSMDSSKRKQPPLVFRAGTREVHNKLEKHRRAHLKECFDILKKQIPAQDEKKTSNLSILHSALRYIQTLKRKERELEHEMERLAREKINHQQKLAILKKDIMSHYDNVDFSKLIPDVVSSTHSSTSSSGAVIAAAVPHEVKATPTITTSSTSEKVTIPILAKVGIPVVTQNITPIKEVSQPVQTTALSVLPMTYQPVNHHHHHHQNLMLQKVAIVPKGLDTLTPLVSTHFIAAPQQLNGKVVPLTQYLVKPLVVVSTASPRPS